MENFLETVILTLFGDATSPREEYLLLQLMQEAIQHEIAPHKVLGRFLESSTVITKMIVTYNRSIAISRLEETNKNNMLKKKNNF